MLCKRSTEKHENKNSDTQDDRAHLGGRYDNQRTGNFIDEFEKRVDLFADSLYNGIR